MYKFVYLLLIILSIPQYSFSKELTQKKSNTSSFWFSPQLEIDKTPVCKKLLAEARDIFPTEKNYYSHFLGQDYTQVFEVAGMNPVYIHNERHIEMEKVIAKVLSSGRNYYIKKPVLYINGEKYYIHSHTKTGCGGACNKEQMLLSKEVRLTADIRDKLIKSSPPPRPGFMLYRDKQEKYWLYQFDESGHLVVYRLLQNAEWEKSCKLRLHPPPIGEINNPDVQEAHKYLSQLKESVSNLTRGAGACGSLNTHWRWRQIFDQNLRQILYRPWPLTERLFKKFNDDGIYELDLVGLKKWSLTGVSENLAFQNYLQQYEETILHIAKFYQKSFAMDKDSSEKLARTAITYTVSRTIEFYEYYPIAGDNEKALRQAILEKQSLSKIKSIDLYFKDSHFRQQESLLSLAVRYPQALAYLLEQGLNPNHENAFSKTPLMYAAQFNQYESAKILLEAGANPNIRTTKPFDTCYYSLYTVKMTALHYAVRYASPKLIKLLLDHGAVPFFKADDQRFHPAKQETPLDWLNRYTEHGFEEKNNNIPDQQIDVIKKWLSNNTSRSDALENYISQADKQYQSNNLSKSYQLISIALAIEPENPQVLSKMSLIAYKSNHLGVAIKAAEKLLNMDISNQLKAKAWFHKGLACEKSLTKDGTIVYYNDKRYCTAGFIYPLYKALDADPTPEIKNKFSTLFASMPDYYCELPFSDIKISFASESSPFPNRDIPAQTLFVFHKNNEQLSEDVLSWYVETYSPTGDIKITPKFIQSIRLGFNTLSVYQSNENTIRFPYTLLGYQCLDGSSVAKILPECSDE